MEPLNPSKYEQKFHTQVLSHPKSERDLGWIVDYREFMSANFCHSMNVSKENYVDRHLAISRWEIAFYALCPLIIFSLVVLRGQGFSTKSARKINKALQSAVRDFLACVFIKENLLKKQEEAIRVLDINASYVSLANAIPRDSDWVINIEDDARLDTSLEQFGFVLRKLISLREDESDVVIDISDSFEASDLQNSEPETLTLDAFGGSLVLAKYPFLTCNTFCAMLVPARTMRLISKQISNLSQKRVFRLLPCDWVLLWMGLSKRFPGITFLSINGGVFTQMSIHGKKN